uniref:O-acetyl-ADP-ribose deacetylase (Regulator of RNase III), contains Macro domain n=1 Tax=Candidatus Kentrum sp. LPFa TaxID=2126335 RepID=A0A450W0V6_9GAMM|nr:MAG: O-acetyl-ADP-ribose deacetylase (regulator of RNase III), contains Macro domain [Candidatus Kentron sp. LPFa]
MITILVQDITTLDVDAIVNAANTTLLGGGGVDGAIHRAAGSELKETCRRIGCCPTGNVEITPGFRLPAKWVIHAVGPVWSGGDAGEADLLAGCYRNTLELALQREISTIAFPAISTGVYGYPKPEAARIALGVIREYEERFQEIIICCFREEDAAIYRAAAR